MNVNPSRTRLSKQEKSTDIGTTSFHDTTAQVVFRTTEDRVKLIMKDYDEHQRELNRWRTPLGILISLGLQCLNPITAKFGVLTAEMLTAILWVATVLAGGCALLGAYRHWKVDKVQTTVDYVISQLKKEV